MRNQKVGNFGLFAKALTERKGHEVDKYLKKTIITNMEILCEVFNLTRIAMKQIKSMVLAILRPSRWFVSEELLRQFLRACLLYMGFLTKNKMTAKYEGLLPLTEITTFF